MTSPITDGVAVISHTSWPLREVLLRELDGLGPELGGDAVVVDVLGELEISLVVCPPMSSSARSRGAQVLAVLADGEKAKLVPAEERDVAPGDDARAKSLRPTWNSARAAHQRVVDVEEGDDRAIGRGRVRRRASRIV